MIRPRHVVLAAALVAGLAACGETASTPAPSGNAVTIHNFQFGPSSLTVANGTTVTWTNTDGTAHTTTSDSGDPAGWDSMHLTPNGGTFSFKFTKPGTYGFHCNIHQYMTGTITVSG